MRFKRGFTLIELLVVLAIVAMLATIAVPRYYGSLEKSKDVVLRQNLSVLRDTIDKFHADRGRYPQSLPELVESGYLRAIPADPVTESSSTWIEVPPPDRSIAGVYDVRSGAPGVSTSGVPYVRQ